VRERERKRERTRESEGETRLNVGEIEGGRERK